MGAFGLLLVELRWLGGDWMLKDFGGPAAATARDSGAFSKSHRKARTYRLGRTQSV